MAAAATRYKLIFHAPLAAVEACKQAIFEAGAGHYPNYSQCAFTVVGEGQFLPGPAAQPHIGKPGVPEKVEEAKVEAVCRGEETTRKVVAALKKAHPYEEPSYEVYKMEDF